MKKAASLPSEAQENTSSNSVHSPLIAHAREQLIDAIFGVTSAADLEDAMPKLVIRAQAKVESAITHLIAVVQEETVRQEKEHDHGAELAAAQAIPESEETETASDYGRGLVWMHSGAAGSDPDLVCCNQPLDIDDEWGSRIVGQKCCGRLIPKHLAATQATTEVDKK